MRWQESLHRLSVAGCWSLLSTPHHLIDVCVEAAAVLRALGSQRSEELQQDCVSEFKKGISRALRTKIYNFLVVTNDPWEKRSKLSVFTLSSALSRFRSFRIPTEHVVVSDQRRGDHRVGP